MELYSMDSNLQPLNIIENFESLIWTERYSRNGDFEIKSSDIKALMDLMPKETCVCLRDSTVPMMVETYKINKPLRQAPSITIYGRSFETVLERRGSIHKPLGPVKVPWSIPADKESDAAYKAMRVVLGDAPRYQAGTMTLPLLNPAVSPLDAIPEIDLIMPADYITPIWSDAIAYSPGDIVGTSAGSLYQSILAGTNKPPVSNPTYWTLMSTPGTTTWGEDHIYDIKVGNLYGVVLELININHRGLKAVRPAPGSSKAGIEIYNGANLTDTVVFDAKFDQFDDATYLLSEQGSADVAYMFGSNGSQLVLKTTSPEPSGLDRRVLVVDQTSDATTNTADARKTRALIELYKYNATALFDGQVAIQVAEGYNRDYFLGDIIKLSGEYGLSQNVRVAEFIRSVDASGEKAFPAFEAVDD